MLFVHVGCVYRCTVIRVFPHQAQRSPNFVDLQAENARPTTNPNAERRRTDLHCSGSVQSALESGLPVSRVLARLALLVGAHALHRGEGEHARELVQETQPAAQARKLLGAVEPAVPPARAVVSNLQDEAPRGLCRISQMIPWSGLQIYRMQFNALSHTPSTGLSRVHLSYPPGSSAAELVEELQHFLVDLL